MFQTAKSGKRSCVKNSSIREHAALSFAKAPFFCLQPLLGLTSSSRGQNLKPWRYGETLLPSLPFRGLSYPFLTEMAPDTREQDEVFPFLTMTFRKVWSFPFIEIYYGQFCMSKRIKLVTQRSHQLLDVRLLIYGTRDWQYILLQLWNVRSSSPFKMPCYNMELTHPFEGFAYSNVKLMRI